MTSKREREEREREEREREQAQARENVERQLLELFDVLFVRRSKVRAGRRYSPVEAAVHDAHERPEDGRLAAATLSLFVVVTIGVAKLLQARDTIREHRRQRRR